MEKYDLKCNDRQLYIVYLCLGKLFPSDNIIFKIKEKRASLSLWINEARLNASKLKHTFYKKKNIHLPGKDVFKEAPR